MYSYIFVLVHAICFLLKPKVAGSFLKRFSIIPLLLKFLLCSDSGLHGATSPAHPPNIYIRPITLEIFFNCDVRHRRASCEEFKYLETQKSSEKQADGMNPCWIFYVFPSDRPSPGLRRFVQACRCGVASSNFSPPSSPVLNTLTRLIPTDTPPPATSSHPGPISPHFQDSSLLDPLVRSTAGTPPAHQTSNSHYTSFELFTLLPPRLAHPLRPRARLGYPDFQQDWHCHPTDLPIPSTLSRLPPPQSAAGTVWVCVCVSGVRHECGDYPASSAWRCGWCGWCSRARQAHPLPLGCLLQVIITPKACASLG